MIHRSPQISTGIRNKGTFQLERILIVGCMLALLAQLPSGIGHAMLGVVVYLRDVFLGACIVPLLLLSRERWIGLRSWPLVSFCCSLSAVLFWRWLVDGGGGDLGLFVVLKWFSIWVISLYTGYTAYRVLGKWSVHIWLIAVLAYSSAELVAGRYEYVSGTFLLQASSTDETAAGVKLVVHQQQLEDQIRVRGGQRSVFQYSNLMGVGALISFILAYNLGSRWVLCVLSLCLGGAFVTMMVLSGGRSAIIGFLVATPALALAWQRKTAWSPILVCAIWAGLLLVSVTGIAPIVISVVDIMGMKNAVTSVASSLIRDVDWSERWVVITRDPWVMLFGVPLAAARESSLLISDNWLIWLMYHTGLIGLAAFVSMTVRSVYVAARGGYFATAAIVMLAYLLGEGYARESFFFYSATVYFFLQGAGEAEVAELAFHRASSTDNSLVGLGRLVGKRNRPGAGERVV